MTLEDPQTQQELPSHEEPENAEKTTPLTTTKIKWWGWAARICAISIMLLIIYSDISLGLKYADPLIFYSTLMPIHTLTIFVCTWLLFKNRATGNASGELVSVIIPIYNQEEMIESVIDALYKSHYPNFETVAVDDGSRDNTGKILDQLQHDYPRLKVIHKANGGKRTAVAEGFNASQGNVIILMDSDSIIHPDAINEFMKAFAANPKVGGMVGEGRVWNSETNLLTKCQTAWYDYCFNIHKRCESYFGTVLCCSGCLAAYRREAIRDYIPYWVNEKTQYSDDRQLTTYTIANTWARREMAPIPQRLKESMASYDDAEDRGLTAHSMVNWETIYVPSALVYTDVPENIKKFYNQQLRWKKGYLRTNFYVSAFFWRKNILMALLYYIEFMTTFTSPLISFIMLVYSPLVLHDYMLPVYFVAGQIFIGLAAGIDRFARGETKVHWIYNGVMNLFLSLVMTWVIIPALLTIKEKRWLTR